MSTTLADITTLIDDRRRDATTNSITAAQKLRAINSTLDIWSNSHDWPWTIKDVKFNYNANIDWYQIDNLVSDFKVPLTIKPYKSENKSDELWMVAASKFDSAQTKIKRFAVVDNNRVQYLRMKTNHGSWASLHTATRYDDNGTWVGATAISNVSTDEYEGFDLPTSVKFDYSGTSGTLTNNTFRAVDLSAYVDRSNIYCDVFIPEIDNFTSVTIKWGSSASDYYQVTVTTDYLEQTPDSDRNWYRFKFEWYNPTVVGTPVSSAIDYLQITISYSSNPSATGFRIQNIFISENVPMVLSYYSTNMVYDVSGSVQLQKFNDVTATTDYPLWSGRWDAVTEPFVDSVLEIIFFMTGEYTDMSISTNKVSQIVESLKKKYPTKRRNPSIFITQDINL